MTLDPLLTAPAEIQVHVALALAAALLGPVALYRRRRDRWHRRAGYAWVVLMAGAAVSGLFIEAAVLPLGFGFGPIHALSVLVLVSLATGLRHILQGRVRAHAAAMRSLYWQALGIAGLFTLLPGRRMNAALFGEADWIGLWLVGLGAAALVLGALLPPVRRRLAG